MHGNRAKVALPDTAAMRRDGLFDRGQRPDFAGFIIGMRIPGKFEIRDLVQFGRRQRRRGRIMDQVAIAVLLDKTW